MLLERYFGSTEERVNNYNFCVLVVSPAYVCGPCATFDLHQETSMLTEVKSPANSSVATDRGEKERPHYSHLAQRKAKLGDDLNSRGKVEWSRFWSRSFLGLP